MTRQKHEQISGKEKNVADAARPEGLTTGPLFRAPDVRLRLLLAVSEKRRAHYLEGDRGFMTRACQFVRTLDTRHVHAACDVGSGNCNSRHPFQNAPTFDADRILFPAGWTSPRGLVPTQTHEASLNKSCELVLKDVGLCELQLLTSMCPPTRRGYSTHRPHPRSKMGEEKTSLRLNIPPWSITTSCFGHGVADDADDVTRHTTNGVR